ncbi:MAG: SUF system NifU family Fe-S cluster assembly protein [Tissierellia bacterium]|nr:SUF system NifU family Fe-S cluster assembly protein [Tissierellia bacterium]
MGLDDLYTQIVLEHSQSKKNHREVEDADIIRKGHNPSCGDEISLEIKLTGNKIEDISYTGIGCAISKASTSIMCDLIRGKTIEEALALEDTFRQMVLGEITDRKELKALKDARAFSNMKNMPARIKCATLPWYTLEKIFTEEIQYGE